MWMSSWLEKLQQILNRLSLHDPSPRIGIIGIGNELRGDDSVGVFIVRRLNSSLQENESLLILDAGTAPENCTSLLRRFAPDLVILIDAAEMGQPPGSINWMPWEDSIGFSASTHSLPLHIFANYLALELKCEIILLGIQPLDTRLDAALSPAVRDTAEKAVLEMIALLSTPLCTSTTTQKPFLNNLELPNALGRGELCQEQIRS